jgi:hypothetical protein
MPKQPAIIPSDSAKERQRKQLIDLFNRFRAQIKCLVCSFVSAFTIGGYNQSTTSWRPFFQCCTCGCKSSSIIVCNTLKYAHGVDLSEYDLVVALLEDSAPVDPAIFEMVPSVKHIAGQLAARRKGSGNPDDYREIAQAIYRKGTNNATAGKNRNDARDAADRAAAARARPALGRPVRVRIVAADPPVATPADPPADPPAAPVRSPTPVETNVPNSPAATVSSLGGNGAKEGENDDGDCSSLLSFGQQPEYAASDGTVGDPEPGEILDDATNGGCASPLPQQSDGANSPEPNVAAGPPASLEAMANGNALSHLEVLSMQEMYALVRQLSGEMASLRKELAELKSAPTNGHAAPRANARPPTAPAARHAARVVGDNPRATSPPPTRAAVHARPASSVSQSQRPAMVAPAGGDNDVGDDGGGEWFTVEPRKTYAACVQSAIANAPEGEQEKYAAFVKSTFRKQYKGKAAVVGLPRSPAGKDLCFVFVEGLDRCSITQLKKHLRLVLDMRKIRNIQYVNRAVTAFVVDKHYAATMVDVLKRFHYLTILSDFDPGVVRNPSSGMTVEKARTTFVKSCIRETDRAPCKSVKDFYEHVIATYGEECVAIHQRLLQDREANQPADGAGGDDLDATRASVSSTKLAAQFERVTHLATAHGTLLPTAVRFDIVDAVLASRTLPNVDTLALPDGQDAEYPNDNQ